jgi:hypothetical protein
MLAILSLLLSVFGAGLGFVCAVWIIGITEEARSHPRFLIAGGAGLFLLGLVCGAALIAHPTAYSFVLFVMMFGIGAATMGWEAEKAWDTERADFRKERMRTLREQMLTRPVDAPLWERQPGSDPPKEKDPSGTG